MSKLLFNIPEGYGEAAYSLQERVAATDAIVEGSTIIVEKVGKYEIQVTTAATEAVPSAK